MNNDVFRDTKIDLQSILADVYGGNLIMTLVNDVDKLEKIY